MRGRPCLARTSLHRPISGSWRGIPYSTLRGINHQVPFDFDSVEVVPKSGTYVTPIQLDRYIEACFIRLRLETGAVRRAAERQGGFEGIIRLEACIREQEEMLAGFRGMLNFAQEVHSSVMSPVWQFVPRRS